MTTGHMKNVHMKTLLTKSRGQEHVSILKSKTMLVNSGHLLAGATAIRTVTDFEAEGTSYVS